MWKFNCWCNGEVWDLFIGVGIYLGNIRQLRDERNSWIKVNLKSQFGEGLEEIFKFRQN